MPGHMPDLRQPKQNGRMVLLDLSCPADPFRLFPLIGRFVTLVTPPGLDITRPLI